MYARMYVTVFVTYLSAKLHFRLIASLARLCACLLAPHHPLGGLLSSSIALYTLLIASCDDDNDDDRPLKILFFFAPHNLL